MDKNEGLGFKAYWKTLTGTQRLSLRNQFLLETDCAYSTFYNKKDNPERFTKLERDVIARIVNKDVEILFPKEETNNEQDFN